jgi:acyl-coenzyme A synthetase/AMP-(fatty) acid ligase
MQSTLITREVINKNIKYYDMKHNRIRDYDYLREDIDRFKNMLVDHGAVAGQTVFNFLKDSRIISSFIACCELGLITCVCDIAQSTVDLYWQMKHIDAKNKSISPINFVLNDERKLRDETKTKMYIELAETVIQYDKDYDCSYNNKINATNDSVLMMCCSSGTTGTPKPISHTHSFMYELGKRNSKDFYGGVMYTKLFHHGSSFATFFLPALMAEKVERIYININKLMRTLMMEGSINNNIAEEDFIKNIDHIQFPYTEDIIEWRKQTSTKYPNLNIYTLAKIDKEWKNDLGILYKEMISLFGSSETSGPILIQKLSDEKFESDRFIDPDGWYDPQIVNGKLNLTGDKFEYNDDGSFKFLGRDDTVMIQGQEISLKDINDQASNIIGSSNVVIDTREQKIYLCIWCDNDGKHSHVNLTENIQKFKSKYNLDITHRIVNLSKFMCGIKVDNEAIRDHFRLT